MSTNLLAYYNDINPFVCSWVQNLISAGLITPGKVDCKDIAEVDVEEIRKYDRVHFFCGIAGWEHALNLAGWGCRPVVTASLPCQPFSVAGKQKGEADKRHLWPEFYRIIKELRPVTIFGEQVTGAIKLGWLDGISTDLEKEGYAVGSVVLGAHSVGAPHIRQRLWWVGYSTSERLSLGSRKEMERKDSCCEPERSSDGCGVEDPSCLRRRGWSDGDSGRDSGALQVEGHGLSCGLADSKSQHDRAGESRPARGVEFTGGGGMVNSETAGSVAAPSWNGTAAWWPCRDGKLRRIPGREIEPEIQRVVDGISPGLDGCGLVCDEKIFPLTTETEGRAHLLRGYGNAIVPQVAAEFVGAVIESIDTLK